MGLRSRRRVLSVCSVSGIRGREKVKERTVKQHWREAPRMDWIVSGREGCWRVSISDVECRGGGGWFGKIGTECPKYFGALKNG